MKIQVLMKTSLLKFKPSADKSKLLIAAEILMVLGAIAGSTLLALNIPASKWGYMLFLFSSSSGIYVGLKTKVNSLTILNLYFTIVNAMGVYRWMM